MCDFCFTAEDSDLIIRALEALREFPNPEYLDSQIVKLERRVMSAFPHYSDGEIKNICLGLQLILQENPLDWKAENLHMRLQQMLNR